MTFSKKLFLVLLVFSIFSVSVSSFETPTEIKVKSPYQVTPGDSVPIYVSVNHLGLNPPSRTISEASLSSEISSIESASLSDAIMLGSVEVLSPQESGVTLSASSLAGIQSVSSKTLNEELVATQDAVQAKQQLDELYLNKLQELGGANLSEEEKTQKLSEFYSEYTSHNAPLENIIRGGKYREVFLLEILSNHPEGEIQVPVKVTYTAGDGNQETVIKTVTVEVTSSTQPRRVIIIDIDAAMSDALYDSVGNMPYLKEIIDDGVHFTDAKTVFPSITMAAQASIFTGNYPSNHGITGNSWFEKNSETYRDYFLGTWWDWTLDGQANNDLSTNVQTIYEAGNTDGKNSTIIFNQYARGVDTTPIIGDWIRPGVNELVWSKVHQYYKIDESSLSYALTKLNEDLPDILTIYLTGLDGYSHYHGPEYQEYYLQTYLDEQLGRLLYGDDDYSGIKGLLGEGASTLYDETVIAIVSDHGQTAVTDTSEYRVRKREVESDLEGAGYYIDYDTCFLNPLEECQDLDSSEAVVASNAGIAHIYIKDNDDWNDPPEWYELEDAVIEFSFEEYTDRILVKDHSDGEYKLYQDGELVEIRDDTFSKVSYPNARERIEGLYSDRSGDIILLAEYPYYFAQERMKGEHGNLGAQDSKVPLIISGPGVKKNVEMCSARNIDMAPTIADLLGFSMPDADGSVLKVRQTAAAELTLEPGWNLVSVNVIPDDTSPRCLMQSIDGSYSIVWGYDSSDSEDQWKRFIPGSNGNDLTEMGEQFGYWVRVNASQPQTLTVDGEIPTQTSSPLYYGWNLIGYPNENPQLVGDALASIDRKYNLVWQYNASDLDSQWRRHIPGSNQNELDYLTPGFGYWVRLNVSTAILTVSDSGGGQSTPPQGSLISYHRRVVNNLQVAGSDGGVPQIPEYYEGYVTVDGSLAGAGTRLTMEVASTGEVVADVTLEDVGYMLDIQLGSAGDSGDHRAAPGDALVWKINGVPASTPAGDTAQSGGVNADHTLSIGSVPVKIAWTEPAAGELSASPGDEIVFLADAVAPDPSALTLTWKLDGVPQATGGEWAHSIQAGAHTITLIASDGGGSDSRMWTLSTSPCTGVIPEAGELWSITSITECGAGIVESVTGLVVDDWLKLSGTTVSVDGVSFGSGGGTLTLDDATLTVDGGQ